MFVHNESPRTAHNLSQRTEQENKHVVESSYNKKYVWDDPETVKRHTIVGVNSNHPSHKKAQNSLLDFITLVGADKSSLVDLENLDGIEEGVK